MAAENNQESIVSHLSADTDSSTVAIHHTLGPLPFQASPGSHVHDGKDSNKIDYNSLLNLPDIGGGAAEYTSTVKHEVKLAAAIAKGQAVYVSSADGTNMVVSKASNASEATSSKTMGLLESGGATNAKVNVVTEGLLAGLNTSTATAGDPIWLGTDGNLIYGLASKPVAPAHLVFIGIVTRANSSNGEIFVKPQNGFELNEIHDVLITSVAPGEVIQRTSSNLWENKTLAEANIAAADHLHTGVYSPVAHTHDDRYYTETETDTLLDAKISKVPAELVGSVDLNDYTTTGLWIQSQNAEASTGTNYPAPYAGILEVVARADAAFIYQRYTTYQPYNVVYYRSKYLTNWSSWKEASAVGHNHDDRYYREFEIDDLLASKSDTNHTHDDRYYTETEITSLLSGKSDTSHTHDDRYYTETEMTSLLSGKANTTHSHVIADVTGLSTSLADKADADHVHVISDTTGLQAALDDKAPLEGWTVNSVLVANGAGAITASTTINTTELGYLNGVTSNIQTQLNDKAAATHLHTGVYSPVGHTHAISDVTNLQTTLDSKENEALFKYEDADTLKMSSISTSTTASVFGTNGVAVEGSTTYFVEGVIFFTAGVVGTSATHSLGWGSPSGAATVTRNSIFWDYNSSTTALTTAAATSGVKRTGSTTFQPLNTITMTGTHLFRGAFSGLITFNAAGNFTPRLTVTPTSASVDLTVNQGSFIKLTKVATGATLTNGTWA